MQPSRSTSTPRPVTEHGSIPMKTLTKSLLALTALLAVARPAFPQSPQVPQPSQFGGDGTVVYGSGEIWLVQPDIESHGYGQLWGHTRIYSSELARQGKGFNGVGWFAVEVPFVMNGNPNAADPNTGTIIVFGVNTGRMVFDAKPA